MNYNKEFESYFKRYYTPLGMYVTRLCKNPQEAEDIVQETFSIAWEKFSATALPDNFKAYLYRVAHNLTIDRLKSTQSNESSLSVDDIKDVEPTEESIDTSERDARLWIAISKLPPRCREVFLLSKHNGLSNAEIAKELDISIKTVENQMTKAFKSLRNSLQPEKGKVFYLPFL